MSLRALSTGPRSIGLPVLAGSLGLALLGACAGGEEPSGTTFNATTTSDSGPATVGSTDAGSASATATASATASGDDGESGEASAEGADGGDGDGDGDGDKLDVGNPTEMGCGSVDLLFVVDNSSSMKTYQDELVNSFPGFVDAIWENLPADVEVHVGITTTTFAYECSTPEVEQDCQTTADPATVAEHYVKISQEDLGLNGAQGQLFEWNQQKYFAANTGEEDKEALTTWFSQAMTAAGELGCTFEMPVASAGWVFDPLNAEANSQDGVPFVHDDDSLLVIFFLTDEPDKTPDSKNDHVQRVLDAKAECGGAECVITSGLIRECVTTPQINNKLWQFMKGFGDDNPPWGDIYMTDGYSDLIGTVLAENVVAGCTLIP